MKKAIAILFILIANIVLLVHAVVPHHDHENMLICLFDSHCRDCDSACNETDCDTPAHHQDKACTNRCCIVDNMIDPSDSKEKTIFQIHTKCDCRQIIYLLLANAIYLQDFTNDTLSLFLFAPYIVASDTEYIVRSLGLRAPPCC